MIRPNVVTAPRQHWDDFAGLGLIDVIHEPVGSGSQGGGGAGARVIVHQPAPRVPAPPVPHPKARMPIPVIHPKIGAPKPPPPPPPKPPACKTGYVLKGNVCVALPPPPPKPPVCTTGFVWSGTQCVAAPPPPPGSCPGGGIRDASGNCAIPPPPSGICPPGYVIDAAGNCTNDPQNPYSLYLPDTTTPPSGANPAVLPPCDSGQFDATGNCITATGLAGWLHESTLIPGYSNLEVSGGAIAAIAAFYFFHKSGARKR